MADQTGPARPQPLPAGVSADWLGLFDEMSRTLEAVRVQLDDASDRERQLSDVVLHWITQAQDTSLSDAARATYLDCAETVTGIYA